MIIKCLVGHCPYCGDGGFCRNKLTVINENGMCGHLWDKRGLQKPNAFNPVEEMYKEKIIIEEGEFQENEEDVGGNGCFKCK